MNQVTLLRNALRPHLAFHGAPLSFRRFPESNIPTMLPLEEISVDRGKARIRPLTSLGDGHVRL
jgi:hypothetical protein